MSMTRSLRKLGLLSALYLSQGLPFGFFTQALPVQLRGQQVSLAKIGLTTLLAMPWALKFLFAPVVDRYGSIRFGQRRVWIVPLQIAAILLMFGVSFVDPKRHLALLLVSVVLANFLAATQDIATDALAVDLLTEAERGWGNGVQIAAYRAGMIIGGGVLLIVHETLGWAGTFRVMAIILALATIPIILHREKRPIVSASVGLKPRPKYFDLALALVRRAGMLRWLLVLVLYKAGESLASGMFRQVLVDRGLTLKEIGFVLGTAGFLAGLVGAMFGGYLAGAIGRRQALLVCGVTQAFAVSSYIVAATTSLTSSGLYGLVIFEHIASGMATATLFTMMMDMCHVPESAASDYTLQASVVVIATGAAGSVAGISAQQLGYAAHFTLATGVCVLTLACVAWLTRRLPNTQPITSASVTLASKEL